MTYQCVIWIPNGGESVRPFTSKRSAMRAAYRGAREGYSDATRAAVVVRGETVALWHNIAGQAVRVHP